jgi:di/tripeptidase
MMEKKKPKIKNEVEEVEEIIAYFEENMQIDGLRGKYGVGIESPDVETYVGNKAEARAFVIDKFRSLMHRVIEKMYETPKAKAKTNLETE